MKRTKFIAGALVLSMGLLGTGYAYWTDAISVSTTVDTGNLSVKLADNTEKIDYANSIFSGVDEKYTNFDMRSTIGEKGDELKVELENLVPGASGTVETTVKNDGTVATRLAKITPKAGTTVNETLQEELDVEIIVNDSDMILPIYKGKLAGIPAQGVDVSKALLGKDILFVPGANADEDIKLQIKVSLPKDTKQELQDKVTDIILDFTFEQAFEPVLNN